MPNQTDQSEIARFVVLPNNQRETTICSTHRGEDPEQFIQLHEKLNDVNRWDDEFRLTNVIFYLYETVKVWFQSHEETIESWKHFKEELQLVSGNTLLRKKEAEGRLATKIRKRNETITSYVKTS